MSVATATVPPSRYAKAAAVLRVQSDLQTLYGVARRARPDWYRRFKARSRLERSVARSTVAYLRRADREFGDLHSLLTTARRKAGVRKQYVSVGEVDPDLASAMQEILQRRGQTVSTDEMMRLLADVAMEAGASTLADLGMGTGFEWADPEVAFDEMFPELVRTVRADLSSTIKTRAKTIAELLARAANPEEPMTVPEAMRDLRDQVATLTRRQAETIVRTETARVYGEVADQTMRRNGIDSRMWLTAVNSPAAEDKPVCDTCLYNATLGFVPMDESFSDTAGDEIDAPPAHPRCRCDIAANYRRADGSFWLPPREAFTGDEETDLAASVMTTGDFGGAGQAPLTIYQHRRFKRIPFETFKQLRRMA